MTAAAALRTGFLRCSGFCALALTGRALYIFTEFDFFARAECRLFKGNADCLLKISALSRLIASSLLSAAEAAAERAAEHIEYIFKATEAACSAETAKARAPHAVRVYAGMAESVIFALFIGVRQNAVCFVDFLKFFFRFLVSGILVGMILHRHLSESFFDFILARSLL